MSSLPPALMRPLVLPRENLIVRTHIIWGAAQADHESHRIDRFSEKYTRWGADSPGEGRAIRILQVNFPLSGHLPVVEPLQHSHDCSAW